MPAATSKDQKTRAKSKPPPAANWPWWKLVGLVVVTLGLFAVLFALYPAPSNIAIGIAILVLLTTAVVAVWSMPSNPWWAQITYINAWLLFILGIGIRSWAAVIPVSLIWIVPIVGAYIAAWMLPIIKPEFSLKLAREQVTPKTVVGRVFVTVALIIASIAAAIAPSFGLFGPRYGLQNEVYLFIAVTSTIATIGLSQYLSSYLWPQRPWAESES